MGLKNLFAVGTVAICCASCAPRTPTEMAESTPSNTFESASSVSTMRDCLVPKLDRIQPFSLSITVRRPAQVREMGDTVQIFAQEETVTLYVVSVSPRPVGSKIEVRAYTAHVREQINDVVRGCVGV